MSIWAQIEDDRVNSIPPDGRTQVDIYAVFSFGNAELPEGAQIRFIIGRGELPSDAAEPEDRLWTLDEINTSVTPIDGIELISDSGERAFECTGLVQERVVRNTSGALEVQPVAKCSIAPIDDILVDDITIIAYSDFDKIGTVERLQPQQIKLTIMSGEGVFLSVAERYDPATNAWEQISSMSFGRAGLFCEEVGGKVYAIGGFNGNFTDAVEEYDPSTDTWETKAKLPIARGYGSSAVISDKIYVIGGYDFRVGRASDDVHRYDPATDTWETLSSLPVPLAFSTAQVVGGDIYVQYGATEFDASGGVNENAKSFNLGIFKYDVSGDSWSVEDVDTSAVFTPVSTSLLADSAAGDDRLSVSSSAGFFPYGTATVDRGGASEETFVYKSFDAANGFLIMDSPLSLAHSAGDTIHLVGLPENRIAPNSFVDGTTISTFNGMSFLGFDGDASNTFEGSISTYDTASKTFDQTTVTSSLPRTRAGDASLVVSGSERRYVVGGSAEKSDFLNELEFFDIPGASFTGPSGIDEMTFSRHSVGAAAAGGLLYAVGGGGSGHPPGWLQIMVTASPTSVRADGKQDSGILITALDDSGDPPPDGTEFSVKGIIFIEPTEEEREAAREALATQEDVGAVESETGAAPVPPPSPKISILPVLFSSKDILMVDGAAATIMFPRSEDPIKEVENLFQFVQGEEDVPTEEQLKSQFGGEFRHKTMSIGASRQLYMVAVEVAVRDDFFFGQTDTDGAIAGVSRKGLSSASSGFNFNPGTADQGLSASVTFFSDISSIPDVELLTDDPVDAIDAKGLIDEIEEEIPFGASPHFDGMVTGIRARAVEDPAPPLSPPGNLMVTTSDNDESYSSNSAQNVAEEANDIAGNNNFPIFITSFIVTDPISLAARRARTDVADLEFISFETGGNSFSIVDSSYVDFVIERINTSAPSSIGSGTVIVSKEIDGTLSSIRYVVEGVPGNPGSVAGYATNSAEMRVFTSQDNYNFEDLGVVIPPNVTFTTSATRVKYVRYEIVMRSRTFDSPILKSATFEFVEDNVQFLFTLPQQVSGQVAELAVTANHRLPSGGDVEMGYTHGESIMFDRDYRSENQPSVTERGTIMAVNRSFDTFVGGDASQSTQDVLETEDFLVYRSKSGPWPQEAVTRVFLNNVEVLPDQFLAFPERALIAFRKRLSPEDKVAIEVQMPENFRVGLKVVNPSLQKGKLDEFAFMFGATQEDTGVRLNRAPRAVNLFITPEPVAPGGPIEANYTFVDPDGDDEDESQTEINWFRNGAIVPEVRNLRSFTNSDLIARRSDGGRGALIAKGQEWFFSVRPSDGRAFGAVAVSHKIVVSNLAPVAENARLESAGEDPTVFTSSDSVVARFDFTDADDDQSESTIYTWFVNGVEVKSGSEAAIAPGEVGAGNQKLLSPGNTVFARITPSDGSDFGVDVDTPTITIESTPPSATDVSVLPSAPSSSSNLKLLFDLVDVDNGSDNSSVAWFKNDQRVTEVDNLREVSSFLTAPGQRWYAVVTPNNGFVDGEPVKSNVVVIQF